MVDLLRQLELDQSFYWQFAIFVVLFAFLSRVFFKPFLRLIELRRKRTVEDREAAEKLMQQAQAKLEEYKRRLAEERLAAKREYESVLDQAKREEAAILGAARDEAKKITQDAAESISRQRDQIRKSFEADIENLARSVSERLLSRKV